MILGIDTSAYTTSVAIVDSLATPVLDLRKLLAVPEGQRGLRQSEAVFQHIINIEQLAAGMRNYPLSAVAVSSVPRPKIDSYMPVFRVGQAFGKMLAATIGIPFLEFSHQEGHIMAGLWSAGLKQADNLLVLHISGGTSDVLQVEYTESEFNIVELGSSQDLHAGQFIDRVGVALGADFPAGKQMDDWANGIITNYRIASAVDGYRMSFSGPESAAQRLITSGVSREEVSRSVFICIARTIEKVIRYAFQFNNYDGVLLVGGVACNSILKTELTHRLPYKIFFCNINYSSDNAVGVALLGNDYISTRRNEHDNID